MWKVDQKLNLVKFKSTKKIRSSSSWFKHSSKQEYPRGSIVEPQGLHQDSPNYLPLQRFKDPNYHYTCMTFSNSFSKLFSMLEHKLAFFCPYNGLKTPINITRVWHFLIHFLSGFQCWNISWQRQASSQLSKSLVASLIGEPYYCHYIIINSPTNSIKRALLGECMIHT